MSEGASGAGSILNRDLLAGNACFGCGLENPSGLHIEVTRDPEDENRLRARFVPTPEMTGFPGITHGGAIYTALDCLSTWVSTLLGPNREAAWILRSARTVYHRSAPPGAPLVLSGWIKDQGGPWDPLVVHTEARDQDGRLCVEGEFKAVPLTVERFTGVAGIETLPENWRAFLRK